MNWDLLDFWESGEWQVVQENLETLEKNKTLYNPSKASLFKALDDCPISKTRVMICGQDPYPDPQYATGVAFSIPEGKYPFPPTLHNIFEEYEEDLHLKYPSTGNLKTWTDQGVLLWNAYPTCTAYMSMSHHWLEWELLTKEIIEKLNDEAVVFCFLGGIAREFVKYVKDGDAVIEASHPSPRASLNAKHPFKGSRIFSTINDKLVKRGFDPIDWRLP